MKFGPMHLLFSCMYKARKVSDCVLVILLCLFLDFDIWFWNCSPSVVCLFSHFNRARLDIISRILRNIIHFFLFVISILVKKKRRYFEHTGNQLKNLYRKNVLKITFWETNTFSLLKLYEFE